jgi:hypothetical protein
LERRTPELGGYCQARGQRGRRHCFPPSLCADSIRTLLLRPRSLALVLSSFGNLLSRPCTTSPSGLFHHLPLRPSTISLCARPPPPLAPLLPPPLQPQALGRDGRPPNPFAVVRPSSNPELVVSCAPDLPSCNGAQGPMRNRGSDRPRIPIATSAPCRKPDLVVTPPARARTVAYPVRIPSLLRCEHLSPRSLEPRQQNGGSSWANP